MKKFGIIGTACCGKTTLCYQILARLKQEGIKCDGVLQQDCRINFDRSLLDTEEAAQWSIIANQLKEEADMALRKDIDVIITDRSPLDLYMYYQFCFGGNVSLHHTLEIWCRQTFTSLYLLHPVAYEESAARCTDTFRMSIHQRMLTIPRTYKGVIQEEQPIPEASGQRNRDWIIQDILQKIKS